MGIEEAKKNPINMMIADADDQTLEAVIQLRKKVGSQEERFGFVKGLYYISLVDADYTRDEKVLVEGTACALGINESTLTYMEHEINDDPDASIDSFATAGSMKYRQQLFEEMAALTYLKGYQLAEEDRAMMKVAKAMGIKEDKAEKTMYELYMAMQGLDRNCRGKRRLGRAWRRSYCDRRRRRGRWNGCDHHRGCSCGR